MTPMMPPPVIPASGPFPGGSSFTNVERDDGSQDRHPTHRVATRMTEIASSRQLLAGLLRWVVVLVPAMLLLGFVSAALSNSGEQNAWFADLAKPALYPPARVVPIVWSVAYVLMGVALSMIASARGSAGRGAAIWMFALHLALNFAWSPLFFGAHRITLALVDVGAMVVTMGAAMVLFSRLRPLAAVLLVPVMGWLLFASVLNWQVLALNPHADGAPDAAPAVHVKF